MSAAASSSAPPPTTPLPTIDELWRIVDASSSIAGRTLRHLIDVGKVSIHDAIDAVTRASTQAYEMSNMQLEDLDDDDDDVINEANTPTAATTHGEKDDGPSPWKNGEGINLIPAMTTTMNNGTLEEEEKSKAVTTKAKTTAMTTTTTTTTTNMKKENNSNDKNKYRTRHVALQFCYDGTHYSGYAQNIGKEDDMSVERTLFAALEKTNLLLSPPNDELVLGEGKEGVCNNSNNNNSNSSGSARSAAKYSRCGRTDKGVHAHGQVIALRLRSAFHTLAKRIVCYGDDNSKSNIEDGQQTLLLDEEALPKNSFDSMTFLVPTTTKSTSKSKNKSCTTTTPTTTTMEQRTITELDYPKILNGVLPSSIRILGWCPVSPQFSARFSCSNRTYRYHFPHRSNLDLDCMAKGLQYMMGRHDFRNFCKMNCEQVYNFERVILSGTIVSPTLTYHVDESNVRVVSSTCTTKKDEEEMEQEQDHQSLQISSSSSSTSRRDMCHIEIVGQAFLWHQIRCIMSILFYIGRKQEVPEVVHELVDVTTNPAKPAYDMASETALVLHHCEYTNINFGRSVRNLWDVTKTLERQWEEYAIAAERIRDALDSLVGNTAIQVRFMDLKEFIEKIADSRANKMMKRGGYNTNGIVNVQQQQQLISLQALQAQSNDDLGTLSWGEAITIIQNTVGIYPYPPNGISHEHKFNKGLTETTVHIPIMDRARGTTYEEKVQSITSSRGATTNNKRKERYEQNIVKKRKTTEEDAAFYNHMLQQGGSSI